MIPAQNTPAWEDWRGHGIGASEVYRAFRNPLSVYLHKVEGLEYDADADPDFLAWGHDIEPAILANRLRRAGWYSFGAISLEHPTKPWHRGSLDTMALTHRLMAGDLDPLADLQRAARMGLVAGPVEAKGRAFGWRDFGADLEIAEAGTCPPDIRVQVMAQCYLLRANGVHVDCGFAAVSVGGQPPRLLTVPYDAELYEGEIVPAIDALWDRILRRDPPEPTDSDGAAARWPRATDEDVVELDPAIAEHARAYIEAKAAVKAAGELADRARLELEKALTTHARGVAGAYKITWSNVAGREVLDAAALKSSLPNIYEQFVRETKGHRALRVTEIKARKA